MPPKAQQELTFLISTGPDEATIRENRRRVRSVAALRSWPGRRKRTFQQYEDTIVPCGSGAFLVEPPSQPTPQVEKTTNRQRRVHRPTRRHGQYEQKMTVKQVALPITPPRSPSHLAEPFNQYPVPYEPWHDKVLHHLMNHFAPRGWPALRISNQEGLHWEWFAHQQSLAEPAFFWVRLLFASGDLVLKGVLKSQVSYWLRTKAVTAINEALSEPSRATSDALILAVGRISMHECFYGDRDAAHYMHRPAQARMVQMRGGMDALNFPPLVKRLMRWADDLMARQGRTCKYLADEGPRREFSLKQSVDVLEQWVPSTGVRLRDSIKISDLVNDEHGW